MQNFFRFYRDPGLFCRRFVTLPQALLLQVLQRPLRLAQAIGYCFLGTQSGVEDTVGLSEGGFIEHFSPRGRKLGRSFGFLLQVHLLLLLLALPDDLLELLAD